MNISCTQRLFFSKFISIISFVGFLCYSERQQMSREANGSYVQALEDCARPLGQHVILISSTNFVENASLAWKPASQASSSLQSKYGADLGFPTQVPHGPIDHLSEGRCSEQGDPSNPPNAAKARHLGSPNLSRTYQNPTAGSFV